MRVATVGCAGGLETGSVEMEGEEVCNGKEPGATAGAGVAGARRNTYTCSGCSMSASCPTLLDEELESGFLNQRLPFVRRTLLRLRERDASGWLGGISCDWARTIAVPQRAHEMETAVFVWEWGYSSCTSDENGTGSIMSIPVWIAARTDRRDSQFNEGARSSRTVGSESSVSSRARKGRPRSVEIAGEVACETLCPRRCETNAMNSV